MTIRPPRPRCLREGAGAAARVGAASPALDERRTDMHYQLEAIPADIELEGLAAACTRIPKGFDLDSVLRGLPDNMCPCPHWGYMLEGRMLVRYADGSEEEVRAGDVYYVRAGHTAVIEEDTVSVDFSPVGPWRKLMRHVATKLQAT